MTENQIDLGRFFTREIKADFLKIKESQPSGQLEEEAFLRSIEEESDPLTRLRMLSFYQKTFLRPVGRFAESFAILEKIERDSQKAGGVLPESEINFLNLERAEILLEKGNRVCEAKRKFEKLRSISVERASEHSKKLEFRSGLGLAVAESRRGDQVAALSEYGRAYFLLERNENVEGSELLDFFVATAQVYLNLGDFEISYRTADLVLRQMGEVEQLSFRDADGQARGWEIFLRNLLDDRPLEFLATKKKLAAIRAISRAEMNDFSFAEDFLATADWPLGEKSSELRGLVLASFSGREEGVQKYSDEAQEIFQREGCFLKQAELFLKNLNSELTAGEKMSANQKNIFFKSVATVEDCLDVPLFKIFGFGGGSDACPNSLAEARSLIEKIYPKNSPRESLQAFYRDAARFRSRRFKKTVGDFFEKEDGERLTCNELLEIGEREFGFKNIRSMPAAEDFEFFSELKEEIIFYAREKKWPEESFPEILERIREEDKIVAFRNFFESRRVVERALLVPSEQGFLFVEYDAKKDEIYSCEQQLGIRNLFDNFLERGIPEPEESFSRVLEQAESGSCRFDDELNGRVLEKKATEIFFETIGAEIISKGGDFVFLKQPEFIDFGVEKNIEPLSISIVTSLRDSQSGTTLMEKYAGCAAEDLFAEHVENLAFLDDGGAVGREEIGSTGSFAISREFRGQELSSSRLFGWIARFLASRGHRFALLIMGLHARALLQKLEIPFCPFFALDDEGVLDRSGHSEEKQKEWKSYTDDAKVLAVELSKVIKLCSD